MGEKGLFQKGTLWRRSTHIPMIYAGPGIEKRMIEEPVSLLDLYPTLIDLCGLGESSVPEGTSLAPLLDGSDSSIENEAITTYGPGNHSIFKDSWHYIRYADGSEELYDLDNDPSEWKNLALKPSLLKVKKHLGDLLPVKNLPNIKESKLYATPYFK